MAAKNRDVIRATVRQLLRDEIKTTDTEFDEDELDIHIDESLVEISQRSPYEVRETKTGAGSKELDISSITDLLEVEKVEYPIGSDPPSFQRFSIFGNILRIEDDTPLSGEGIYLYCNKVHQLTKSTSTLSPDLESVLVKGAVAKAAQAWLNKMRDTIVPSTVNWYQGWANTQFLLYQKELDSITQSKVWEY
jgi:hypothetical protein